MPPSKKPGVTQPKKPAAKATPPDDRYHQLEDTLELAIALQGSHSGLTYDEIAERFGYKDKTAKRRVRALRHVFGDALVAEKDPTTHQLRFRLRHEFLKSAIEFSPAELAELDAAAEAAHQAGRHAQARAIRGAVEKWRGLMAAQALAKVDPDLEVLLATQDLAMRPGPQPDVDARHVTRLRQAILALRRVELRHDHGGHGRLRHHAVTPLGFLYGIRHYLVAWHRGRRKVLLYRLSRIDEVRILAEPADEVPGGFDLRAYAEQSFGVFQEDAIDTLWRFSPRVADEACEYVFHPNEEKTEGDDGSLLVRIRAGGTREMAWHLFTWGPDVEVLQPASLRREMASMLEQALKVHARAPRKAGAAKARTAESRPRD